MISFKKIVLAVCLSMYVSAPIFAVTNNENDAADSSSDLFLEYAISGDLVSMQELVEQKPDDLDINATDLSGRTALMLAIIGGYEHVVTYLLSLNEIDIVNAADNHGKTALQLATAAKKKYFSLTTVRIEYFLLKRINGPFGSSSSCAEDTASNPAYLGG